MSTITPREEHEVLRSNEAGTKPVVFVHGLWLLAESWTPWRALFERAGFSTVAVDWPGDPADVAAARNNPQAFAGVGVHEVADHVEEVIRVLNRKPILVGHSFGGLLVQILAGRGLAAATVAVDPAPARGVLPLPLRSIKAAAPVLLNPRNRGRAVTLSFEQFRFGFANAVSEDEARALYEAHHVAGAGRPVFQAATGNVNPFSATKANAKHPERGPMLFVSGENDNTVPAAITRAAYRRQRKNAAPTEIVEIPGRGHSLVIDAGWEDVARVALGFAQSHGTEVAPVLRAGTARDPE